MADAPPPGVREYRLKLVVIGHANAGKTSIIKRYVNNYFSRSYKTTVGVDFALKVVDVDSRTRVHLQLWDVGGQERFGAMTRIYYKNAVGALIVWDVTERRTYEALEHWRKDIADKLPDETGAHIPLLFLGNKVDLARGEHMAVPEAEVAEYVEGIPNAIGVRYVSAKENENVGESVRVMIDAMLAYVRADESDDDSRDAPLDLHQREERSTCCFGGQSHQAVFQ